MTEILTDRLRLRRFRMDDIEPMHRLLSDPQAMRYWSTLPHQTVQETEAWVRSEVDAPAGESDDFVVELAGQVIGKIGCWKLPEVGYLFDPAVWGQGLATEAMHAFIGRRRALGRGTLTADVDPRNLGSIRLLRRCGFVESGRAERTWNIGGEWCDSVYLTLDL